MFQSWFSEIWHFSYLSNIMIYQIYENSSTLRCTPSCTLLKLSFLKISPYSVRTQYVLGTISFIQSNKNSSKKKKSLKIMCITVCSVVTFVLNKFRFVSNWKRRSFSEKSWILNRQSFNHQHVPSRSLNHTLLDDLAISVSRVWAPIRGREDVKIFVRFLNQPTVCSSCP